jgi:hypothetical protein
MTREEREQALLEEFKAAHNNIMTVMENHIMPMTGCDRKTANLVANEVLDLDREIDSLLETPTENIKNKITWDRLSEIATQALHGLIEDDYDSAMEYFRDTIDLTDEEREYFGVPTESEDEEEEDEDFEDKLSQSLIGFCKQIIDNYDEDYER